METSASATIQIHAVALEVSGAGILLFGDSGAGKSDTAYELLTRGHKLVADDAVLIERHGKACVLARAHEKVSRLLDVRNQAIVDVTEQFGEASFLPEVVIELCIDLSSAGKADVSPICLIENGLADLAGASICLIELAVERAPERAVAIENAVADRNKAAGTVNP